MSFSVATTKWTEWVRISVVQLEAKFPDFSFGTYPGHDPLPTHAADAMVPAWQTERGRARGWKLANWVARVSFCKPRGVHYVIFAGKIWSMTRPARGWLPYFDRNNPNPSRSHHNHIHISWYKAKPRVFNPEPEPAPYTPGWVPDKPWVFYLDRQQIGVTKSDSVWLIQKALGLPERDGNYTQELRDAVKAWQLNVLKDDPKYCDGILGRLQARALFNDAIQIEDEA